MLRGAGSTGVCHQATEGEECHGAVTWAMEFGIWEHPEWYQELTPESPFEAFQAHLNNIHHGDCPQPCNATLSLPSTTAAPIESCRQVMEGEECYKQVTWAMYEGIYSNPEWYPNLTTNSSFEAFQAHLHDFGHGHCPMPCSCQLQVIYYTKVCQPFHRCGFAGRYLQAGQCLQPTTLTGHYVRVGVKGSESCFSDKTATAVVEYFKTSDCSGTPDSTMVIPTNDTRLTDGCRDIYGQLRPNYTCSAGWIQ